MEFSELTIRLLFLFSPGILALIIIEKLVEPKSKSPFYFLLYSLLLGFLSYCIYFVVVKLLNALIFLFNKILIVDNFFSNWRSLQYIKMSFFDVLCDSNSSISIYEVFFTLLISLFISIFIVVIINRNYLNIFAHFFGLSNRFGDSTVWGFLCNSDDIYWVRVRNIASNIVYEGRISAFSDNFQENELFLTEVSVYKNDTGEFLYEVPALYITSSKDNLNIEFPVIKYCDKIITKLEDFPSDTSDKG